MSTIREPIIVGVVFLLVCVGVRCLVGCSGAQVKGDEAEASYLAQQLRCVDQYNDRPSIDRCREDVTAKWHAAHGITETAHDAGKD